MSSTSELNHPLLKRLELSGWRQFESIGIDFHPRLTILTGQNGAGKTTILNLIAPHFGWSIPMATIPSLLNKVLSYVTGVWKQFFGQREVDHDIVAQLHYSNGDITDILVPKDAPKQSTYRITYSQQQPVEGLYIPSHRPLFLPSDIHLAALPNTLLERRLAFESYVESFRPQWTGTTSQTAHPSGVLTPLNKLKEVLLGLPEGARDDDEAFTFRAFEAKLSKVLPPSLHFESLERRDCEVVLNTSTGEFSLDAVSGGIAAVVDITWQIFLYPNTGPFVVLIDEPENHLHPEMQRTILPQLTEAFPEAQFIVSTHAPMVVTSMKECAVYALIYQEPRSTDQERPLLKPGRLPIKDPTPHEVLRVHAIEQREFSRAGTADDTLRRILGLDYTMPQWAAKQLHESAQIIVESGASDESLAQVKQNLVASGLGDYMSEVLETADNHMQNQPWA